MCGAAERLGQIAAVIRRQVEIVHRAGDRQIGIGVEPADERAALVAQIALHLEHVAEQGDGLAGVLRARFAAGGRICGSAPARTDR